MVMNRSLHPIDDAIAEEITRQLSRRAATSSICPSEVARALQADEAAWRALMPQVREVAAAMRREGRLRITSRNVNVTDNALHCGAIRLARGPGFLCGENLPAKHTL